MRERGEDVEHDDAQHLGVVGGHRREQRGKPNLDHVAPFPLLYTFVSLRPHVDVFVSRANEREE